MRRNSRKLGLNIVQLDVKTGASGIEIDKMENEKSKTKRIVKNTLFLYTRMILVMFVSFYTSRIVLDKLGVVDFGIHSVVGGMASMFVFFRSSLSNVTQRCLNVALEKGDFNQLKDVFCTHRTLYIVLSIATFFVAEIVGVYLLKEKLVIPEERYVAAFWTLQLTLVSLTVTLLSVVYDALVIAHENMKIFSYVGIYEAFAKLGIAFLISTNYFDRLIFYSALLLIVSLSIRVFYIIYCGCKYKECSFKISLSKNTLKETSSLVSWNLIENIVFVINNQGVGVLLNMFFGPTVNAAKAIASQVGRNVDNLALNFSIATRPQITKSYVAGDYGYLLKLFYGSSKYSFFLLWFFCLPMMFCVDEILGIWLKNAPEKAGIFVNLILAYYLVNVFNKPIWSVALAVGKLKKYICVGSGVFLMSFPISYLCLKLDCAPESVLIVNCVIRFIYVWVVLSIVKKYVPITLKNYFKYVILPISIIVVCSGFTVFVADLFVGKMYFRGCILGMLSVVVNIFCIGTIGLTSDERKTLFSFVKRKFFQK